MSFFVVTNIKHIGCDKCIDAAKQAIAEARVTGSVGATHRVIEGQIGVITHSATVKREE